MKGIWGCGFVFVAMTRKLTSKSRASLSLLRQSFLKSDSNHPLFIRYFWTLTHRSTWCAWLVFKLLHNPFYARVCSLMRMMWVKLRSFGYIFKPLHYLCVCAFSSGLGLLLFLAGSERDSIRFGNPYGSNIYVLHTTKKRHDTFNTCTVKTVASSPYQNSNSKSRKTLTYS